MVANFRTRFGWVELIKRTITDTFEDGCPGLAAFLLALFPTLLFLVSLLAYIDSGPVLATVVTELQALVPQEILGAELNAEIEKAADPPVRESPSS